MATIETERPKTDMLTFRAIINKKTVELIVPKDKSLLDILREDLDLVAAKKGCDIGTCGTCMVIIDGTAIYSCIQTAEKANGKTIETVENLSKDGKLHPIQKGFMIAQGFQCGICTSGFLMSAKALLDKYPDPTDKQIKTAIHKNICRCTGYQQLVEAVKFGAGQLQEEDLMKGKFRIAKYVDEEDEKLPWKSWNFKIVGKSQNKVAGAQFVTGEAKYTADLKIEGMLHGATVRSTVTHANIRSIDTSEAEKYPGVAKVLTWKDVPGENAYGKKIRDQQVFMDKKVRCIGEPIALVIAETREAALEAIKLVKVDYEVLPGVYDPEEAMKANAPKVHERDNVFYNYHLEKGDIEKGFKDADVIVERKYKTHPQDHTPLEPEAALAFYDKKGLLTVYSPGQSVFFDRLNIIRALGIPKDDVRCIQPAIGAAYGKREDIYAQIHAALACLITQKPVKIEWTREETMLVTAKRTQQRTWIKMGVKKDGKITAIEAKVIGDSGAYASWSTNIMRKAGVLVSGPYEIPNGKVDSYAVYTNNPLTGATRGFGAAETNFCNESHMDEAAFAIGMDPMEFRLKNALRNNSKTATEHVLDYYVPVEMTIKEADKNFNWNEKKNRSKVVDENTLRGVGMSTMWYGIGFGAGIPDTTDVIAELHEDGTATLYVGTVDYGNGSNTTFTMLGAEVLGLDMDQVKIINGDSARTLNCGSTVATKQTYTTGNAVVRACLQIRKDIFEIGSEMLGIPQEEIDMGFGFAYSVKEGSNRVTIRKIAERFREFGKPLRREGRFQAGLLTEPLNPKTGMGKAWFPLAFGTHMAEVDVNTKSGKITVNKIVAAHYVGKTLNPRALHGQVVGGISFGIGFALWEDCNYKDGIPQNINYDKYRLMRSKDYPDIEVIAIEKDERTGPFGAIGVGEPPTIPVAAAISNAVYDAIGVRIFSTPFTKEKVLKALAENLTTKAPS
jgi:CO/xanthine dehydrogenase Mo-binding subunit/aerobic-type carbon monoxide dehydrogenase small subunit (CoxS/CutS family)